jgi:hypothetical protein
MMAQRVNDRRRHRVMVTRNTEYHFRGRVCVAVRDRKSGDFLGGHLALRQELLGALKRSASGVLIPTESDPSPGDALYFLADGVDLVTSPLLRVERPAKEIVSRYPAAE